MPPEPTRSAPIPPAIPAPRQARRPDVRWARGVMRRARRSVVAARHLRRVLETLG